MYVRSFCGLFNYSNKKLHVYLLKYWSLLFSALTCSALPQPENGQIDYSDVSGSAFELGTTATYSCNTGYGLSEALVTRTCQSDDQSLNGEWSGESPTCIGKKYYFSDLVMNIL